MKKSALVDGAITSILLLCGHANAETTSGPPADEAISMEFLEYLATFQTEDGEQVDPMSLESVEEEKDPADQDRKGEKK